MLDSELLEKIRGYLNDEREEDCFKAIAARADWKLGRTILREGREENKARAQELLDQAMEIRRQLPKLDPNDKQKKEEDLTDDDWDKSVFYLYR